MARGMFRKEFFDSTPSEPALSNPTNAKMASTVPTRMPPGLTPVSLSWWVSKTVPLCTQMLMHRMRMTVTERLENERRLGGHAHIEERDSRGEEHVQQEERDQDPPVASRSAEPGEEVRSVDREPVDGRHAGHDVPEYQPPAGGVPEARPEGLADPRVE